MKKVLILSLSFPPHGGPGVQRMAKFVRYLPDFGWEPVVLAGELHTGEPYDEELLSDLGEGSEVYRFPGFRLPAAINHRLVRAFIRALVQPDPHRIWAQRALPAARRLVADGSFSAVLSTDPAGAHWLGWILKREFGLPWIMDIRDLWTGAFTYIPVSFPHALLDSWYERSFLCKADRICCVTGGYPQVLQQLHPSIPAYKYIVIPNGYDEADFCTSVEGSSEVFRISYVGSVYNFQVRPRAAGWKRLFEPVTSGGPAVPIRSPEVLLRAVQQMLDQELEAREKVRLRFVGTFPAELRGLISSFDLEGLVEVTGYVSHSEAVREMLTADALVLMQDGEGSEVVIPGKLYEYLRSGTAVLGMLREGLAADIIRQVHAGDVVGPGDSAAAAEKLKLWYRAWRSGNKVRGAEADMIAQYSRRLQTAELAALLDQVADE